MTLRSFTALLVLANYLLLAVMGCISKPEDDSYLLLIKSNSSEGQRYESQRFMRMDGIEDFMAEALATRYKEKSDNHDHIVLSVISSIDAHFLPEYLQIPITNTYQEKTTVHPYLSMPVKSIALAIYSPPDSFQLV